MTDAVKQPFKATPFDKEQMWLQIFNHTLNMKLDLATKHSLNISVMLTDEVKSFEEEVKERMGGMSEEEQREYEEYFVVDEYTELARDIPHHQKVSELLSICSMFESLLKEYCGIFKTSRSLALSWDDIRARSEIERAEKYLSKLCGISFPETDEISEIKMLQSIRNLFVHHDGRVDSRDKTRMSYLEDSKFFDVAVREGAPKSWTWAKIQFNLEENLTIYIIELYGKFFEQLEDCRKKTIS